MSADPLSKSTRTRKRLQAVALDLFERQGFDATTVAQIASAAGVTSMTFFRHFKSKSHALLEDPYDPLIAAAIEQQCPSLQPLHRVAAGLRQAWGALPEPAGDVERRRVRVVAATPSLWGAVQANNERTERAIVDRLVADGTDTLVARAAAAAALAAITAALFEWSRTDDGSIGEAVGRALSVLDGTHA